MKQQLTVLARRTEKEMIKQKLNRFRCFYTASPSVPSPSPLPQQPRQEASHYHSFQNNLPLSARTLSVSQRRWYGATDVVEEVKKSPFESTNNKDTSTSKRRRKFIPPKAAVELTPKARQFFKLLLESPPRPGIVGIMLNYKQASSGQPRMVFTFDFVSQDQISKDDEGISLELLEDGTPKPPKDSMDDGLPKLYIAQNGFMKVLGCKLDVDIETMQPILYDREGLLLDPNVT